ncbi:MAG: hypothetical protein RSD78_03880 [Oscillospiraceae bacterium]
MHLANRYTKKLAAIILSCCVLSACSASPSSQSDSIKGDFTSVPLIPHRKLRPLAQAITAPCG